MKKNVTIITSLVAIMFSVVFFHGKIIAQVPYGIFDKVTGTLTLGYGNKLPEGAVEVKTSDLNGSNDYIGITITYALNVKKKLSLTNHLLIICQRYVLIGLHVAKICPK